MYFKELSKRYGHIYFRKKIPSARWGDVWRTNQRTGELVRLNDWSQLYSIRFDKHVPIQEIIDDLILLNKIEYAHPPIKAINFSDTPNDSQYTRSIQWNLFKIDAEKAWNITKGISNIRIGIVDASSIQPSHEDLNHKFVVGKGDTGSVHNYHGNQVAGAVGAKTNNDTGLASLGWNVMMIPYSWEEDDTATLVSHIYDAINTDSVSILNCSFGLLTLTDYPAGPNYYPSVKEAIEDAIDANIVVVAAIGNTPFHFWEDYWWVPYPAAYNSVIGVAATDSNDIHPADYNYEGDETRFIDVAAPGFYIRVLSTSPNTYIYDFGTSFSAPQVSALAGLIRSINNTLSTSQIETIIEETAVDLDCTEYFGSGRINAYEALKYTLENYGGTLSGDVTLTENLTIQSGDTLTIESGTTVKFESGVKLTINGTLLAEGTSSDSIIFTSAESSPSPGDWEFINITSTSTNSVIKYCRSEYAEYGIRTYNSAPTIEKNTFKNNKEYGVYLYGFSGSLETNKIVNNRRGIYGYNVSNNADIDDNLIRDNTYDGLHFNIYSDPILYDNTIDDNGTNGAYFYFYCEPEFGDRDLTAGGYNVIIDNSSNGIYANYNSDVFLGELISGNTKGGRNSIYDNSGYNIKALSGSDIEAEHNWWQPTPSSLYWDGSSSIDTSPYLPFDPEGGSSLAKSTTTQDDWENFDPDSVDINNIDELWTLAYYYRLIGKPEESIDTYKLIVEKFPDSLKAKLSLVKIFHVSEKSNIEKGVVDYYQDLVNDEKANSVLRSKSLALLSAKDFRKVNFPEVENKCKQIIEEYPNTEDEEFALHNLVFIEKYTHNDEEKAQEYTNTLKQKYPNKELTLFAQQEMGEDVDLEAPKPDSEIQQPLDQEKKGQKTETIATKLPVEYALHHAYPNPFNPTTTIRYDLPEATQITITIYNIRGQKISQLVDKQQEAGYHSIVWNARNQPSGLYICKMKTSGFMATQKLMLLK